MTTVVAQTLQTGYTSRGATEDDFRGQFLGIFEIFFFCFVVICNLVHDVETIFHISYVLTASGNLF